MHEVDDPPTTPPAARPPKRRRRMRTAIAAAGWLYLAAVAAVAVVSRWADDWWPATLLAFAPLWVLTLPAAALVPAAAVLRRRSLLPVLAALALALGPASGFCLPVSAPVADPPAGFRLRVLTCNLHYLDPDPDRLARLLSDERPDVAVFQERRSLRPLGGLPDGFVQRPAGGRQYVVAALPLRGVEVLGTNPDGEGSVVRYRLGAGSREVTVFGVHLATPRGALWAASRLRAAGPDSVGGNSDLRRRQSEWITGLAGQVDGPVVVAGDFNTPPPSVLFREVWGGYADSFSRAGWGWGYTFFGGRTATRIDHVLAGPGWRCDGCRVGPDVGSPHRPVVADLTWVGEPER